MASLGVVKHSDGKLRMSLRKEVTDAVQEYREQERIKQANQHKE